MAATGADDGSPAGAALVPGWLPQVSGTDSEASLHFALLLLLHLHHSRHGLVSARAGELVSFRLGVHGGVIDVRKAVAEALAQLCDRAPVNTVPAATALEAFAPASVFTDSDQGTPTGLAAGLERVLGSILTQHVTLASAAARECGRARRGASHRDLIQTAVRAALSQATTDHWPWALSGLEFHNGPWASLGASPAGDGPARSVRQLRLPVSAALYAVANRDLARAQPWWRPEFVSLSDAEVRVAFAAYSADADLAPGAVGDRPCHSEILAYVNSICSVGERPRLDAVERARPIRGVLTSAGQPGTDAPAPQEQAEPAGLCSGWLGLRSNPEAFVVTLDGDERDLRRGTVRPGPGLQQLLLESVCEQDASGGPRATDHSSDHVPFLRPHLIFPGGSAPGEAPLTPPPSVDVSDVADATSPDAFPRFLLDVIGAQGRRGSAQGKWAAFFRYTEKEVGAKGGWVMVSEGRSRLVGSLASVEAQCKRLALAPAALVFQQPAVLRPGWAAVGETFMRHALARRVFTRGFGADPPVDPWRSAPAVKLPWGTAGADPSRAGAGAAAVGMAAGCAERMKGTPDPWTKEPVQSSIRVYLPLSGEVGPA
ncbi:hypothetical protein FNF29_06192 [Cafeteria roenbergensis]|uniref:Uncharacterized protein n=1 Tax=Cafeteria roenbergensis TaxID=33653 RepID=A0A5A8C9D6_CAFRO|nr:hypothetical protein FNF29_06192 [Cafeteria roenbergensis]|eukprot:KAA0149104.1 hypothetical protein FNF29_06192 [Cafeteria roenbergensis]